MATTESLASALAILQTRLPDIKKEETAVVPMKSGGTYTYTYAGLAQISRAILPLLGELGMSFTAWPGTSADGKGMCLRYELLHASGENRVGEYPLSGTGTPQSMGSAITYARRYCLLAVTGLAPDEDDDAAAAQAEAEAQPRSAQRQAAKEQAIERRAAPAKTQRAQPSAGPPPLPGEAPGEPMMTPKQQGALFAMLGELGITEAAATRTTINGLLEDEGLPPIVSRKDLTAKAAGVVIDGLQKELDLRTEGSQE